MAILAFKRSIGRVPIGVLVSTQLAVAAYACSGISNAVPLDRGRSASVADMTTERGHVGVIAPDSGAAMNPGCDSETCHAGIDATQPNLCGAHCHQGQQSSDHASAPVVPPALLTSRYEFPALDRHAARADPRAGLPGLAAAVDPPHAILHCCLRN